MAIDQQRRARLAALVSTFDLERNQAMKAVVEGACGHSYADVQHHAWGMCDCAEAACPPWVEAGFAAAEQFGASGGPQLSAGTKQKDIGEVLGETALEMTGLLRGVVLDDEEIKSSKDAEEGDVFASSDDD